VIGVGTLNYVIGECIGTKGCTLKPLALRAVVKQRYRVTRSAAAKSRKPPNNIGDGSAAIRLHYSESWLIADEVGGTNSATSFF